MRPRGFRLAMLAVALHATWLGAGGVVCLDALPLAWLGPECPDLCCETTVCCPGDEHVAPLDTPAPSSSCCIAAADVWYHVTGSTPVPPRAAIPLAGPSSLGSTASTPFAKVHAPPEMQRPPPGLVGVVVLQV